MENWEKELLLVNTIKQLKVESIEKSVEADLEKARQTKYFKREGAPGHYKYYYTEAEYKQAKGGGGSEYIDSKPSDMKHGDGSLLTKEEQAAHEKNQQGLRDLADYSKQEQSLGKKVPSSKEIANIFKNKDWGDMGDRISASGNQLEVADSFYAGGKDKLNSIKKEWIDPNGFMAKYMKNEYGVKFTLHSEDIQDTASGKYKKFGKNLGAAIVKLNIEKA